MAALDDVTLLIDELRRCRCEEREVSDDVGAIERTICDLQHTCTRMRVQMAGVVQERIATEIMLTVAVMRMADLEDGVGND